MTNHYAVILCGGAGTRLWPLSRASRPKHLLAINGEATLLQQTARRLLKRVKPDRILTVTHEDHKFEVKGQLAELSTGLLGGVRAEPMARNTLPAIAWAVSEIFRSDPEGIIGVFPSDHAIMDESRFLEAWAIAESVAALDYLTLIGIVPTEAATGYGYIQPSAADDEEMGEAVSSVLRFVEKPNYENAVKFVEQGYLWNGGIFVFRASTFMNFLAEAQPEIFRIVTGKAENILASYPVMPNISMDYGLVEKIEKVAVVKADMGWSDLGSWDSIYQRHSKGDGQNLVHGDVITQDTSGSVLWSTHGLLATLGVNNLAIIQTADATLVCDRSRTEEIKQLVAEVQSAYPHLTETHLKVHRPWGAYTILEEGPNFKIKLIEVSPGAKLSMQLHSRRSEHWVVVSGVAKISNGDQEIVLESNQSTYIPIGHKHRLENSGNIPLKIIEVQCGEYVGEDDILRFDDSYGRS